VCKAFRVWAKKAAEPLKRTRSYKPNPAALVRQAAGCARKAACLVQDTGEFPSRADAFEWFREFFFAEVSEVEHEERFGDALDRVMAHRGHLIVLTV
jgi:hypothetical protein